MSHRTPRLGQIAGVLCLVAACGAPSQPAPLPDTPSAPTDAASTRPPDSGVHDSSLASGVLDVVSPDDGTPAFALARIAPWPLRKDAEDAARSEGNDAEDGDLPVDTGPVAPSLTLTAPTPLEIVQGPQGGIHVEVQVAAHETGATADKLSVRLTCRTEVQTGLVGLIDVAGYKLLDAGDHYVSAVIPIFFADDSATTYEGLDATISCLVQTADWSAEAQELVVLLDAI